MGPRQCLLLMSCANEHGFASFGKYWGSQGPFLRGWLRGGFEGLTTCCIAWSIAIVCLQLSHHPPKMIMQAIGEWQFVLWAVVPPVLISKLLYADWNDSRSGTLSLWERLPQDEKTLWVWCAITFMLASVFVFLVAFFWSMLPAS